MRKTSSRQPADIVSNASPPTLPLPTLVHTLLVWRWPHRYLEWHWRRYGSHFTIRTVGLPPLVFFSDQADIKAIVTAPSDILHPGAGAAVITPLIGEQSFMLQENAEHIAGRKAIMPAFYHQTVARHANMVREIAEREIASWPSDKPFAIHPHLRALTLRVILITIFGRDATLLPELHSKLLAMLSVTDSLALQEPLVRRLPGWRGMWRRFCAERAEVHELIRELINDNPGHKDPSNVLSLLLKATSHDSVPFTPQQVHDGIMSLVLAGHETTASQLAWAFQLIAHDQRVLRELLYATDRDEDTYLRAAIQEVMRHRPVFVFTIPRIVHRAFELAGTTFLPPVHLMGCIHLMHHDPRLYRDPQSFSPERFLDQGPTPHVWLPWGGGRKRCPGHHLALLEMQTVIRIVLERWEIQPVARTVETARWRSVIVTPGRGSRILLKTRRRRLQLAVSMTPQKRRESGPKGEGGRCATRLASN